MIVIAAVIACFVVGYGLTYFLRAGPEPPPVEERTELQEPRRMGAMGMAVAVALGIALFIVAVIVILFVFGLRVGLGS
jgi:hypothetical protein